MNLVNELRRLVFRSDYDPGATSRELEKYLPRERISRFGPYETFMSNLLLGIAQDPHYKDIDNFHDLVQKVSSTHSRHDLMRTGRKMDQSFAYLMDDQWKNFEPHYKSAVERCTKYNKKYPDLRTNDYSSTYEDISGALEQMYKTIFFINQNR